MNQTNQSDIDSLLEQMDQGSSNVAVEQSAQEESASAEDTADSASGQEELSGQSENEDSPEPSPPEAMGLEGTEAEASDPRGTPWVDFVPEFTHKTPETLHERLEEEQQNLDDRLREKEWLKISLLDRNAHKSYYQMWVEDGNQLFRSLIRVKYRKEAAANQDDDLWEC